jgi:hypothetical protein
VSGVGTVHHCPTGGADDALRVSTELLDDLTSRGPKITGKEVVPSFGASCVACCPSPCVGMVEGQYGDLDPMF